MHATSPTDESRMLVVDDSKVSRSMAIGLLRNRLPGFVFDEAAEGEAALALARQHTYRLVLMDYNMPGMHGVETSQRIRELQPDVGIVLLTANGQAAVQAKAEAAGIHLMRKPIRPELADRIAALATTVAAAP